MNMKVQQNLLWQNASQPLSWSYIHLEKVQMQFIIDEGMFSIIPSFRMVTQKNQNRHTCGDCPFYIFQKAWAHFELVAIYPTRLNITGYLSINDIQIIPKCICSRLQVDWMRVMLSNVMKHVKRLPSKAHVSVWTDNDPRHIDPREPYQIWILPKVLDMLLKWNKTQMGLPDFDQWSYLHLYKTAQWAISQNMAQQAYPMLWTICSET